MIWQISYQNNLYILGNEASSQGPPSNDGFLASLVYKTESLQWMRM